MRFMPDNKRLHYSIFAPDKRFLFLFISLLLLFIIYPFTRERVFGLNFFDIFILVILLSSIYAVVSNKKLFVTALILALLGLSARIAIYFIPSKMFLLLHIGFTVPFFVMMAVTILIYIMKTEEVTADTIFGAICVYLFIGVIWAFLFKAIEIVQPGSFQFGEAIARDLADTRSINSGFIYYSFVTLTTLGYGDMIPITPPARSFASLEAIAGQLYLAVLIARLVGLHIAHSISKKVSQSVDKENKNPSN